MCSRPLIWFTSQVCVCSPPLIHISSVGVFSTVDSHLKHGCVLHRRFTSQVCLCSPPLIHISSACSWLLIHTQVEVEVEVELTEPKVELELTAPKVEPSDGSLTCVSHFGKSLKKCRNTTPKPIIQGLGYQITLRNMALVHWGNHNWCYSVTGLLSCC
jgi:hypothetical protein